MLTVYRVGVPIQTFQYFETDDMSFRETLWPKFHGDEIDAAWKAPSVYVFRPKKREGQFVGFLGGRVFAVADDTLKAFPMLTTFFEQSGEQLPFIHEGRRFVVFNCTNCINALDKSKAVVLSTGSIDRYAFVPTRFQFTLFCVPESNELLCVEGMSAPHDEFKGYVEQQKLTGLMFEELWREQPPKKVRKKK